MKAEKFDELANELGIEKLKEWGMRRVDEQFRVIALGAPVPPFKVGSGLVNLRALQIMALGFSKNPFP